MTEIDNMTEVREWLRETSEHDAGHGGCVCPSCKAAPAVARMLAELEDIHNNPRHPAVAKLQECRRQRDALQARIDAMRTVYRFRFSDGRYNDEEYGSQESLIVDYGEPSEREGIETCERTPWREVESSDG